MGEDLEVRVESTAADFYVIEEKRIKVTYFSGSVPFFSITEKDKKIISFEKVRDDLNKVTIMNIWGRTAGINNYSMSDKQLNKQISKIIDLNKFNTLKQALLDYQESKLL